MDSLNLGPKWAWYLILILACFGVLGIVFALIKGIIWLINHAHFS